MKTLPWLLLLGLLPSAGAQEQIIKSKDPVYEAALPEGYRPMLPPETPPRFVRTSGPEDWARIQLRMVPGDKALEQNPAGATEAMILPFVQLPADAKRTFMVTRWKDVFIGTLEYRAVVDNLRIYGLTAVVPLMGKVVTVTVSAPDPLEAEVKKDFRAVLGKFSAATIWQSPENLAKARLMETIGKVGAGLALLYPVLWALLFRGHPMMAHWLRVVWLAAIAVLLFVPILSPGDTSLFSNMLTNGVLPFVFLLFAARRVKLGIE